MKTYQSSTVGTISNVLASASELWPQRSVCMGDDTMKGSLIPATYKLVLLAWKGIPSKEQHHVIL